MPLNFSLISIKNDTTIVLVNSGINAIQGDLRHMDWSTSITNTDSFNIELETIRTGSSSPSTLPLAPRFMTPHSPAAECHDRDANRPSSSSGTQGPRPIRVAAVLANHTAESSRLNAEHPSPPHPSFAPPQCASPRPFSPDLDDRASLSASATTTTRKKHGNIILTKRTMNINVWTKKIKDWFDKALSYFV